MGNVKLSTLSVDDIVIVEGKSTIYMVGDILEDMEYYKDKSVYTTTPRYASFDAGSIIDRAIEDEYQEMYEDWDESISADITKEDVEEIQAIFDRILARSPMHNIAYLEDKLIEFDI